MASTPGTGAIGVELQAAGENLNTWGDPKLNNTLQVLLNMGAKWNALTINGDTTISEVNYSTTNDTEVAVIKLTTGTVAAAFSVTFPSRNKRWVIWNGTSYSATLKLSASSGFALPAGKTALVATDGSTDVYNVSPNYLAASSLANSLDIPNYGQVQTLIANATLPGTSGTFRVSAADTTSGYAATKIVEGSGISATIVNGGANETLSISVDTTELEEFQAITGKLTGTITSGTTAMTDRRRYRITGGTATLPTMAAGSFSIVELDPAAGTTVTIARNSQTIDGVAADDTYIGDGGASPIMLYKYVSAGVVTSEIFGSVP